MATPTQIQQVQYGFAPEVAEYAQTMLGQTAALTDLEQNPYMQYQGERIAQFSPTQKMSYDNAALMQSAPQLKDAAAMAGQAGLAALNTQYSFKPATNKFTAPTAYGNTAFTTQTVAGPGLNEYQMGPAQQTNTQSITGQGTIDQYMSPYMQNVVQRQQLDAQRQADIARQVQGAQAARSGAFGGSGDYLQRAQAAANLARQKGDIQATGSQAAYQQAQQQFNAEQAARLQSQIANQQAGLTVGQQNLASQLATQQLRAGQNLQSQLANQQANLTAQQSAEASKQFGYGQGMRAADLAAQYGQSAAQLDAQQKQFGAGLGLQGLQTANQISQTLGNLGNTQYQQNMGINALQNQYGLQQQAQVQKDLDTKYQDYLNSQNYPYKQLAFQADMLRGVPLSQTGTSVYQAPPSTAQNIGSLALGAAGISKFLGANGGLAQGMANGGMAYSNGGGIGALALNHLV
jgi:hypothetical protein